MLCLGWELVGLHGKGRLGPKVFTCYVLRLALPQPLLQDCSAHHVSRLARKEAFGFSLWVLGPENAGFQGRNSLYMSST